jgi:hypothetical protein
MLIAEDIVIGGVTVGKKFNDRLTQFIRENKFTKLIETGTYHGLGSTTAILNGLSGQFDFYSIEANPYNFGEAKKNLRHIKGGLHLVNGITIGKSELPISVTDSLPEFIVIDHQPANRLKHYIDEVNHDVPDHALDTALKAFNYEPEFVLLDSAGYMGFIEFKYLLERVKAPFYLALDDTDHIKHFQSMEYIREHPDRFSIVWQVRGQTLPESNQYDRDKFGSAIIRVS